MQLPSKEAPEFPQIFNEEDIYLLRVLVIYITGHAQSTPYINNQNPSISGDDINNFKKAGTRLNYPSDPDKIIYIYKITYEWFLNSGNYYNHHECMRGIIYKLYHKNLSKIMAYKYIRDISKISDNDLKEMSKNLTGVYYIYRYGSTSNGKNEFTRSLLCINSNSDSDYRLEFKLVYRARRLKALANSVALKGEVLASKENIYIFGIDKHCGNSPYLLMLRLGYSSLDPTTWKNNPPNTLTGLIMRENTSGIIGSSRVLIERHKEDNGKLGTKAIEILFKKLVTNQEAGVLSIDKNKVLFESIEPYINNNVTDHKFLLQEYTS